jgi:hypothetical protein
MLSTTNYTKILNDIQPLYDKLYSKFSKSYLQGSPWYVGDDLKKWWEKCNNIRYFKQNRKKIFDILEILLLDDKNNKEFVIFTLNKILLQ